MKYILKSEKLKGKILFEFAPNGYLMKFSIDEADVSQKFVKWLLNYIPLHQDAMKAKVYTTYFDIEIVHPDLSFDAFWDLYAYKMGNKKRAEKLYNELSEAEKALTMSAVVKYKRYLSTRNQDTLYPETFLAQRRFENQF